MVFFQDQTIADGRVVIDLIDSIKPGTINYDLFKDGGAEEVIYYSFVYQCNKITSSLFSAVF